MPEFFERLWAPEHPESLVRKDRGPANYRAFLPDELGELPVLGSNAQRAVEQALSALTRADERIGAQGSFLNHLLVRKKHLVLLDRRQPGHRQEASDR